MSITPNAEQFAEYAASDLEGEVVMLNLLKFSGPGDGDDPGGGAGEYGRYADAVSSMVEERGGHLVWLGTARHVFIGDVDADDWDAVALVSYPSRQAFLDMIGSDDYQEAHRHREAGLERTVLIACEPGATFRTPPEG